MHIGCLHVEIELNSVSIPSISQYFIRRLSSIHREEINICFFVTFLPSHFKFGNSGWSEFKFEVSWFVKLTTKQEPDLPIRFEESPIKHSIWMASEKKGAANPKGYSYWFSGHQTHHFDVAWFILPFSFGNQTHPSEENLWLIKSIDGHSFSLEDWLYSNKTNSGSLWKHWHEFKSSH